MQPILDLDVLDAGLVRARRARGGPAAALAPRAASGPGNGRSVYIETYGCQMNVADSELVASILGDQG